MTGLKCASLLEILIYFQCPKEELEIGKSVMGLEIEKLKGKEKSKMFHSLANTSVTLYHVYAAHSKKLF